MKMKRFFLLFLSAFFLICLSSCEKSGDVFENGENPTEENSAAVPVALPGSVTADRELVLIRGNYWVTGIAGFGANSFLALAGEYRLQAAGILRPEPPSGEGDFSVCLTMEPLYFSGEWQVRPGTGNISALQREGEEGFLVAAVVHDSRGTSWIAVFRFKQGLEGIGINGDLFNRILQNWVSRVSYFLSLSKTQGDISLPAALEI